MFARAIWLLVFVACGMNAADLTVTNINDSGPNSLRDCLLRAQNFDRILFDATIFSPTKTNAETTIILTSAHFRNPEFKQIELLPRLELKQGIVIDASDRRVSIDASSVTSGEHPESVVSALLLIECADIVVRGLTIIGNPVYVSNGLVIQDSIRCSLGGDRTIGAGPNGQGMCIIKNTKNLPFASNGIFFSNESNNNTVKGIWFGPDLSGESGPGNCLGIGMARGASNNIIGGTVLGEANVFSGNEFGISIYRQDFQFNAALTKNNLIQGNFFGLKASAVKADPATYFDQKFNFGNIFTAIYVESECNSESTRIENNIIGFNGDYGVVFDGASNIKNPIQGNRISLNKNGAIYLPNGSNEGIVAPLIESVTMTEAESKKKAVRRRVTIRGRIPADSKNVERTGSVELFSDSEAQGGQILGRNNTAPGERAAAGSRGIPTRASFGFEVDVETGQALTATFTDSNSNTSVFSRFTGTIEIVKDDLGDNDKDGVNNGQEAVAGTDPDDASSTPVAQGTVSVTKGAMSFSFIRNTFSDTATLTMSLTLPSGIAPLTNKSIVPVTAKFGGLTLKTATGTRGDISAALKTKPFTALTVKVKKQNLKTFMAEDGIADDVPLSSLTLPVTVALTIEGKVYLYTGTFNTTYSAKKGKGKIK